MKLYAEEQVRKAIKLAQKCEHDCGGDCLICCTETEIIEELTPIELPSDEEIVKKAIVPRTPHRNRCFRLS